MDKLLLWVSIFTSLLSEAFGQADLKSKVFVFPRESETDHVKLIPHLEKPLQNFTLCFRTYSDLSRSHSLFSYSVRGKDNELLIYKERVGEYSLYIGNSKVTVHSVEEYLSPVHLCTTWESSSGIAEFWVNGKPLVKKGLQRGYTVQAPPSIILGQEQDSYGGRFQKSQSFVGEFADLYMWDYVLTPQDILLAYRDFPVNPNFMDWQALKYEINGYVLIRPRVWDIDLNNKMR